MNSSQDGCRLVCARLGLCSYRSAPLTVGSHQACNGPEDKVLLTVADTQLTGSRHDPLNELKYMRVKACTLGKDALHACLNPTSQPHSLAIYFLLLRPCTPAAGVAHPLAAPSLLR